MAYEPTGPGGVNNSYGVRETTPSTKYSPNVRYDEEFTPRDNTIVTSVVNPVTGGMGFNGQIIDMDETPDETNTEDYPVGTMFISPAE